MSAFAKIRDHQAIIGLGTNISPNENLRSALYLLGKIVSIETISNTWITPAVGSSGPEFLNAAVLVSTHFLYEELRNQILRPIETLLGRVRTKDPNAPRTIDLDILIFDGELFDQDLWDYAHMCVPVAEVLPDYKNLITGETLKEIADRFIRSGRILKSSLELHRTSTPGYIV